MFETGNRARFPGEPVTCNLTGGFENLERNWPIEDQLAGSVDQPEAPLGDEPLDLETTGEQLAHQTQRIVRASGRCWHELGPGPGNPVFAHALAEGAAGHAQQFGGARLVAGAAGEGVHHGLLLDLQQGEGRLAAGRGGRWG